MSCLGAVNYDPAAAVTKSTATALAMTALDTTNLRIAFTAPANGKVLVRMRGTIHGATTFPQVLLGILSGSTVIGRQSPIGALQQTALATSQLTVESLFTVSGLTPGSSHTWDAAYAVETVVASTGIKYGGPNDTTTNNAFGGFAFEVWEAPDLLANVLYDPATAVAKSTASLLALTALDTTNLRLTFTAPASGRVLVRIRGGAVDGATTHPVMLLGVLEGSTIRGRQSPMGGIRGTSLATTHIGQEALFVVTGLTPGNNYTFDAAYGVEILLAATNFRYGGPNDTTANNAWGGLLFEIWAC